jgi:hypothetical protein
LFKKYKSFIGVLCKYFSENHKSGGIVKIGKLGACKADVLKKAHKKRTKKKVRFVREKKIHYFDDGIVRFSNAEEGTKGILKADGKNAIKLGKCGIRNGSRKQKFRKVNPLVYPLYYKYEDIFTENEVDVPRTVIVEGCWKTNKYTLDRQMNPEVKGEFTDHPTAENMASFDKTVKVVLRKLKIKVQETCTFTDVSFCEISKDKKPGFRYEECLSMLTKQQALPTAYKIAEKRWNAVTESVKDRCKIFPGVYTIGARNKKDFTYDDGEVAISRAVHMPELHSELTSAPWCDRITGFIKECASGPLYIGNSFLDYMRLNKDTNGSEFVLEGDWKRFDSTLYIKIITCAVAILRCYFPTDCKYTDNHFIALYDTLAIKDYYIPGGRVFRLFHGLPSGVKSTSLIGSIINLIALVYCVGPKVCKRFNFIVGGDDFLISCYKKGVDKDKFIEDFETKAKELGMILKFAKFKKYNAENLNDLPVFYKYCVHKGRPIVPPAAMLERVFIPWNKNYQNKWKFFKFLQDIMPSLGCPTSHLIIYYELYVKTSMLCGNKSATIQKIYDYHKLIYNKMMNGERNLLFKDDAVKNLHVESILSTLNEKNGVVPVHDLSCF